MSSPNDFIRLPAAADLKPAGRGQLIWMVILAISVVAATLALSCVTPFAALAVAVAGTVGLRASLRLVAIIWLSNQVSGFLFFHFPPTANAFGWGIAIGVAALIATIVASVIMKYQSAAAAPMRLGLSLITSFAVYELTLLAAAVFLGGFETFRPSIVAQLAWINAASLAGMIILNELAAMLLRPRLGRIPRLARAQ
jgi:hypothetical protein